MTWDGLNPPYATIVADPPWAYDSGWPPGEFSADKTRRHPLPYSSMDVDAIAALPVRYLAAADAHLYLWTTNKYLERSFDIARVWGFKPTQVLAWCKPIMGIGPGGRFANTMEYVIFGQRGTVPKRDREPSTWWTWPRGAHSVKPAAFYDLVERVSPGPYVDLFCRQPRFGWDSWGWGYEVAS